MSADRLLSRRSGSTKDLTVLEDDEETREVLAALSPTERALPPARSALVKNKEEGIKFMIRSVNPIGQDTAIYQFNKYQIPILEPEAEKSVWEKYPVREWLKSLERKTATLVARVGTLLGRSSGRDKVAAVVQYYSLFWGSQPFLDITGIQDGPDAPWKKLEESMSQGRKVMRLGKWVKEYERVRVALTAPDSYLGLIPSEPSKDNRLIAIFHRVIAVLMNVFSFWYYVYDNLVWAAQSNLIARAPELTSIQELFKSAAALPYEKYIKLLAQHNQNRSLREAAAAKVARWKNLKNYSSLGRLLLASIHSTMMIDALRKEHVRLLLRYAERIRFAQGEEIQLPSSSPTASSEQQEESVASSPTSRLRNFDSFAYPSGDEMPPTPPGRGHDAVVKLVKEREQRVNEVLDAITDQKQDMLATVCNLGILLNRLKFRYFENLPLWFIGVLGVISGYCGCIKNWPKFAPQPKPSKVAKLRSESIDKSS